MGLSEKYQGIARQIDFLDEEAEQLADNGHALFKRYIKAVSEESEDFEVFLLSLTCEEKALIMEYHLKKVFLANFPTSIDEEGMAEFVSFETQKDGQFMDYFYNFITGYTLEDGINSTMNVEEIDMDPLELAIITVRNLTKEVLGDSFISDADFEERIKSYNSFEVYKTTQDLS